jgi:hypothetical protein
MNSIVSKPITIQEYKYHASRVEDWGSEDRSREVDFEMWLCEKLLVDPQAMWSCTAEHWQHHLWSVTV